MAITAQMSLWGLYQIDPTILDGLTIPAGMDSDNLKSNLLLETETLEILYPNAEFLKAAITVWSGERLEVWEKLYATTQLKYNPIENYDRQESGASSANTTSNGSNESVSSNTGYNSNTFKDVAKGTSSGGSTANSVNSFSTRVHGNIGVTSSQQLIESERNVVQFCMTEFIINDFISRFCLGVY